MMMTSECAEQFRSLAELRSDPLLMDAQYDIRQTFLAVIDRVLRDLLDWINRYKNIVHHPEAWQGRDAHLMLVIQAEEELDALHRLLDGEVYALEGGMLSPGPHDGTKGFGLMRLLAAFGLGAWMGGDD